MPGGGGGWEEHGQVVRWPLAVWRGGSAHTAQQCSNDTRSRPSSLERSLEGQLDGGRGEGKTGQRRGVVWSGEGDYPGERGGAHGKQGWARWAKVSIPGLGNKEEERPEAREVAEVIASFPAWENGDAGAGGVPAGGKEGVGSRLVCLEPRDPCSNPALPLADPRDLGPIPLSPEF